MPIYLLGNAGSERTYVLMNTAAQLGITIKLIPFPAMAACDAADFSFLQHQAVKIDPPELKSGYPDELPIFGQQYSHFLQQLQGLSGTRFLNAPMAIAQTLDKLYCKTKLLAAGVSTTPMLAKVHTLSQLRAIMQMERMSGVFIKPQFGSGSAGVIALRREIRTGAEVIYTALRVHDGRLWNTRKLRRINDPDEIETMAGGILAAGGLAEQWIPKARAGSKAYDLRVVWQFGKAVCAVARQSRGPITNLHLGGEACSLESLDQDKQDEIEALCDRAMKLFPGLNSAGLDILLERDTLKPYIIEINGQGDLLYQDISGANKIYQAQLRYLSNQAKMMKAIPKNL